MYYTGFESLTKKKTIYFRWYSIKFDTTHGV